MGLIKSMEARDGGRVRGLDAAPPMAPEPQRDEAREAWRQEGDALRALVAARDLELADRSQAAEAAFDRGYDAGHTAGSQAGADQAAAALARLEAGLASALERLAQDLSGLDRLAAAVARTAIARMLGDSTEHADLVTALVRRQVAVLEAGAILGVEVAAADFPDPAALEALAQGLPGLEIRARSDLGPGDARLQLRLGGLEVGVGQQWGRLAALLDDLAAGPATAQEVSA